MIKKFTVGEMAKFHNMQKQTLIFYDKTGLFCPKIKDPKNGYRYYTPDQFEELDSICMLKEMGLSLNEIKEFMKNRDEETAVDLMKRQKRILRKEIEHLNLIEKRLDRKIDVLEQYKKNNPGPVKITEKKAEDLVIEPVPQPGDLLLTDLATKRLLHRASQDKYPYFYQLGVIISKKNLESKYFTRASYTFLPLACSVKEKTSFVKPAGFYACGYHTGRYEDIHITYEAILNETVRQGYSLTGDSYEYCILDSLTCASPEEYVTKIHIQVSPSKP